MNATVTRVYLLEALWELEPYSSSQCIEVTFNFDKVVLRRKGFRSQVPFVSVSMISSSGNVFSNGPHCVATKDFYSAVVEARGDFVMLTAPTKTTPLSVWGLDDSKPRYLPMPEGWKVPEETSQEGCGA